MVSQRKALELLWKDRCTVYVQKKQQNPATKRMEFSETAIIENQPCKLSFETLTSTTVSDNVAPVTQATKLFLPVELSIPPGSKITVLRKNGLTADYEQSGEPGIFTNHQEIQLELFKGWA